MAGSTFGNLFRITTWGESHGAAVGVTVDGCPAGVPLCEDDIQIFLNRRKPGQNAFTTKRNESDTVEILSGIFDGFTTGTPISMLVRNEDQHSKDYGPLAETYRPGHADYCYDEKYGTRDYRGGGRSSGRETIGRVAAGAIAIKVLSELNISFTAYTKAIGELCIDYANFDVSEIGKNPFFMPDADCAKKAEKYLELIMSDKDSVGSCVECIVRGLPTGIGEPVFDKLDARLAQAIMSIGAVKAVEIGDGIDVVKSKGSENNDPFSVNDGKVTKLSNHAGGVLGGISDGSDLIVRASFKPTPSIFREQQTVTKNHDNTLLEIKGRHDPIIGPRAVVVVEAMCAVTILDLLMCGATARIDTIKKIFS